MASNQMGTIQRTDVLALVRQIQGSYLLNRQLSSICQVNGLKSTGVKAELQSRIVDLIQDASNTNDVARFYQIKQSIANAVAQRGSPAKPQINRNGTAQQPRQNIAHLNTPLPSFNNGFSPDIFSPPMAPPMPSPLALNFKPSPFYRIEGPVGEVRICETMAQHRNAINIPIKLNDSHPILRDGASGSYRIMIFCAGDINGMQDIAFPYQSELRVNSGEFKANLRGLKNKPGSTRPADITGALRLRPNYVNNVEFTYALTQKKFYIVANLCKVFPTAELISAISTRRRIPKQSVINELNKIAQDPDVVATSQVLSLKCPISYMRLDVPCRGLSCSHIQCFDATSYLQLQEQGPQWLCPICNKPAPFDHLAVDEYAKDILENTPKSLEAVTIEPNGRWVMKSEPEDETGNGIDAPATSYFADDDDDDDLEISEISFLSKSRLETPSRPSPSFLGTPSSTGRNSAAPQRNSSKRPAPAVIDLTLSSDDDEPIQRPQKRQNTGNHTVQNGPAQNGLSTNGYTTMANGLHMPAPSFNFGGNAF